MLANFARTFHHEIIQDPPYKELTCDILHKRDVPEDAECQRVTDSIKGKRRLLVELLGKVTAIPSQHQELLRSQLLTAFEKGSSLAASKLAFR